MKLLHIDSSILGEHSASRRLSHEIAARWRADFPAIQIEHRDLVAQELPHLSGHHLAQMQVPQSPDARILADFLAADVIVIGAPMYNFTIPTQLKSWIDRVVVAGKTFQYGPTGPQGLVPDKRVIIALARGGIYPQNAPFEHAESYLRTVFGFMGVTDITFVRAEGLAISPEHRQKALDAAVAAIPVTKAA